MNKTYRFHDLAAQETIKDQILLKKRKMIKKSSGLPYFLAADLWTITDEKGTRPVENYTPVFNRLSYTLTKREADIIALANPGICPPMALEDIHPWLPKKAFLNNSVANFQIIKSIIRKFGHHLVLSKDFCDQKWNTICNSLGIKNKLDSRYYTAWHLPIQDVYLLEEKRPDRSVIAIDFNGMYPACMQGIFPKPSDFKLVHYDKPLRECNNLPLGLYRCILKNPKTDFIQRYNPFRRFFSGHYLQIDLSEPFEICLNEFELSFFLRHFGSIHIIDAVVSEKGIPHPLAKEIRRSFARRKNYQHQGNKSFADREKYLATLMASCASRPRYRNFVFKDYNQVMRKLRQSYGIIPFEDEPESIVDKWINNRNFFKIRYTDSCFTLKCPDIQDGFTCFSLGQRIVAQGRIFLLEMMERIQSSVNDVEICYTNIDSVHFSLPTIHLEKILEWLRSEASLEMGGFKIESVSKCGLWLEPGRYWLYSDSINKFKNRSIGARKNPFLTHKVYVASRLLGDLSIPIKIILQMDKTMSATRSLVDDPSYKLVRQKLIEVGSKTTFKDVWDRMQQNRKRDVPYRMSTFMTVSHQMREL